MRLTLLPLGNDGLICLRCDGMLTMTETTAGGEPVRELLGEHCWTQKVLLSLEGVDGIDTGGLVWLTRLHHDFARAHGLLIVHSAPAAVATLLSALRLDKELDVTRTEADARRLAADRRAPAPRVADVGRPARVLPGERGRPPRAG